MLSFRMREKLESDHNDLVYLDNLPEVYYTY